MSRELAVRVSPEIAAWVRQQQPRSATETVLALATAVYRRRQAVSLGDPGPGDDRLKVRLAPRVLQFLRPATHSRDATTALRKLLRWGYEGGMLPASQSLRSLPQARIVETRLLPASQTAVVRSVQFQGALHPDRYTEYRRLQAAAVLAPAAKVSAIVLEDEPALFLAIVKAALPLVGFALLFFGGPIWRWLFGGAAGTAAGAAATAAKAATVAPTIAAWTPQAAAGLGALFL
jgi:hypothetical protein